MLPFTINLPPCVWKAERFGSVVSNISEISLIRPFAATIGAGRNLDRARDRSVTQAASSRS
jgi:hypothetical protein